MHAEEAKDRLFYGWAGGPIDDLDNLTAAIEREAVLSALDELRAKVEPLRGYMTGNDHRPPRLVLDPRGAWLNYDSVLALIDASRSALETPKP